MVFTNLTQKPQRMHEFTFKLLSHFATKISNQSFASIVFESNTFKASVRLAHMSTKMVSHYVALKNFDVEQMIQFELACSKLIIQMFEMSECIFIEKKSGNFEQKLLLYDYSSILSCIISEMMVQWSVYRALQKFFKSSLKNLLSVKKDVYRKIVLTKEEAANEVQKFGGWALNDVLQQAKNNPYLNNVIRQMYTLPQGDEQDRSFYSTVTKILNQGGYKIVKPQLFKWVDAVLNHIRCFINDDSIMFYRTNILCIAKEDLEKHCQLSYTRMFNYAWKEITEETQSPPTDPEVLKNLRNKLIAKMFNARSKEAMHAFLERNCGRYGKRNTVALRTTLKTISGSKNHHKRADKGNINSQHDVREAPDSDLCKPFLMSGEVTKIILSIDNLSELDSSQVSSCKRPKISKKDQDKLDTQDKIDGRLNY